MRWFIYTVTVACTFTCMHPSLICCWPNVVMFCNYTGMPVSLLDKKSKITAQNVAIIYHHYASPIGTCSKLFYSYTTLLSV